MSIYRGDNKIASVYRGNNKIARVYRGNNLVYSSKNRVLLFVNGSTRVYKAKYVNSSTSKHIVFQASPITNPQLRRYEFTYDSTQHNFVTLFSQTSNTKINAVSIRLGNTSNTFRFNDLRQGLHNVVIDKTKLYIDGNYQQDLSIGSAIDYGENQSIFLNKYDFYEFKIYESGTLLYHFVPCYILVNGKEKYGIAELVNKRYLTDTVINGEQVYGELPEYLVRQAYVKCRDDLPYVMITTTDQYAFDTQNNITEFKVGMVKGVATGNMVFSYAGVTFGASSNKNKYYYRCFTSQTEMGNFYDHEVATYRIEPRAFYKNSEFVSYLNDIRVSSEAQISFYFYKDQPLYYYKRTKFDKTIANFIPVYNILTNQYGIYDLVKGVGIYHDDLRGRAMLPSEYQEVEFLESSGTQHIDSGYVPNANTKVIFDTTMISNQSRQGRHGSGERLSIYCTTSITEFAIGNFQQLNLNTINQRHLFELDVPSLQGKLDGVVKATFSATTWTNQQTLYFFARNIGTGEDGLGNIRNYNIKIYDISVLIRDFVPCYRKGDTVAGLYDLANGIFYTNVGTGTFIVGGDI